MIQKEETIIAVEYVSDEEHATGNENLTKIFDSDDSVVGPDCVIDSSSLSDYDDNDTPKATSSKGRVVQDPSSTYSWREVHSRTL